MPNSSLAVTDTFLEEDDGLGDEHPTFYNLDVEDDRLR